MTSAALRDVLIERVGARKAPQGILDALLSYLNHSQPSAVEAHWHPLGFIDIPLGAGTLIQQRQSGHSTIHIWHPRFSKPEVPRQACHSHGWSLWSTVLCGVLINREYMVRERLGGEFAKYKIEYGDALSRSVRMPGDYDVSPAKESVLVAGTQYEIPHDQYHWSHLPGDDLVVTVMSRTILAGAHPPLTFVRKPAPEAYEYRRRVCEGEIREAVLNDVVSVLSAEHLDAVSGPS